MLWIILQIKVNQEFLEILIYIEYSKADQILKVIWSF